MATRIGTGFDVHRLTAGRRLVLGGIEVPFALGLDGHSDADVLTHAVIDALLGAARCGDIGRLFPDTDPAFKDISSLVLLGRAMEAVRRNGFEVGNVDAVLMAQAPKLAPFVPRIEESLARTMDVEVDRVSVKATTTERLGFVGREEGMAAQAVALVETV